MTNNSTDLAALTKIYAYRKLVSDKYTNVTGSIIREMEKNEDPYVREYAYWSQVLGKAKGNFLDVTDDNDDGVRKWQIALQIQNSDEDFIVSALKPLALCPEKISRQIKTGIMIGLNNVLYNDKYVLYINSWFERETDDSVIFLLIDYIIANCYINQQDGTFFDVLKDSLNDPLLVQYVVNKIEQNSQYQLYIVKSGGDYVLDFKTKGEKIMQNISVSGNEITVAVATDNSSAVAMSTSNKNNELEKLLQEVRKQANVGLSDESKKEVEEGTSFILDEYKKSNPKLTIIKRTLEGLKTINGTIQFASAVASLVEFFE